MLHDQMLIYLLSAIVLGLGVTSSAEAQPARKPCQQIKAACQEAGFAVGSAKVGTGLMVDCVRPIVQGKAQRPKASKPLPQIDQQIVVACKAANPTFGQPKTKQPGDSEQQ
jgi:hypothetical protein